MRYFIGDTETTGLKKAKAVEVAFIEVEPETFEILSSWESFIDPEIPIEPGAQAIHGITAEMVADAPTIEEYVSVILGRRFEEPCVLMGHNVQFDKPFFDPIMNIEQTFCSLALCRSLYPTGPKNHRLGTMKEYLELEGGTAHRAMGDVLTVHQMLRKLLPSTGKTLLQHLQVPARTIYTMPWGEHQGKALMDIPVQYRNWLLSVNIDADLRRSLMQLRAAGI
jgi:DNA polymerase III epsilon subunit-like protein